MRWLPIIVLAVAATGCNGRAGGNLGYIEDGARIHDACSSNAERDTVYCMGYIDAVMAYEARKLPFTTKCLPGRSDEDRARLITGVRNMSRSDVPVSGVLLVRRAAHQALPSVCEKT